MAGIDSQDTKTDKTGTCEKLFFKFICFFTGIDSEGRKTGGLGITAKVIIIITCLFVGIQVFDGCMGAKKFIGRWENMKDPREILVFYQASDGLFLQNGDSAIPFNTKDYTAVRGDYLLHFSISREYFGFLGARTIEMTVEYTGNAQGLVGNMKQLPEFETTRFRRL